MIIAIISSGFGYTMMLTEQQRCNIQGFIKSVFNSFKAAKTFSVCFYDYYSNLPPFSEENRQFYEAEKSKIHDRVALRILDLSEINRGIYLKAGQYVGNLERIMPKEFTNVLKKLQDSGPALPFSQIKVVIEKDLKEHWNEIFSEFDEKAIAAASLAQVHFAKLKQENQEVAVKLQFPFLKTQTFYDLLVLKNIVSVCNKILVWYQYKNMDLLKLFKTFETALINELDFTKETNNAILTKKYFKEDDNVHIPYIYEKYSSERIITMEFIKNAAKINNKKEIEQNLELNALECANLLIETFGKMIFQYGHIHCDAHPGNILIRKHPKNPKKPQLVLLDHGIYRTLSPEIRMKFCELWKSLIEFDNDKVHELAKFFKIEEYSHYLPILFLFRTKNSKKSIGATFTEEEKKYLQNEIISFEKISYLMQALPPDIMFILRASNMIAIHNATLGGKTRTRLKTFTNFALASLYPNRLVYTTMWLWLMLKIFLFESHKRLPLATLLLHEAYCLRNMTKCPDCDEMVDKSNNISHKKIHELANCNQCHENIPILNYEEHKKICKKNPKTCEFCKMSYPFNDFNSHFNQCSSRTELCDICGRYIRMRDLREHEEHCLVQLSQNNNNEDDSQKNKRNISKNGKNRQFQEIHEIIDDDFEFDEEHNETLASSKSSKNNKNHTFPEKTGAQNFYEQLFEKNQKNSKSKKNQKAEIISEEEYMPEKEKKEHDSSFEEKKSFRNEGYATRKKVNSPKNPKRNAPAKDEIKEKLRKQKKITSYDEKLNENEDEEELAFQTMFKPRLKKNNEISPKKKKQEKNENTDFEIAQMLQEQLYQEELEKKDKKH